jgi:hypothetical protein
VKAAAPQAPGSTHQSAKTRAKGRVASAKTAGAAAFAGVLEKAVAARSRGAVLSTAVRIPTAGSAAKRAATDTARGMSSSRIAADTAGRRRTDEAPSAQRTAAESVRTAAAQQHAAVAVLPADRGTAVAGAAPRRGEPRVQVVDLRKKPSAPDAASADRSAAKAAGEKGDAPVAALKPFAERLAEAETDAKISIPARSVPLARIREMTGSDLVRTVGLVVRDGGGEIRLTLKPESLGSVRIRLSIEDGRIDGKIVVDTPEARQAFEAGIDSLTRALHADGFQTGALTVSVSGGNANDSRQAADLLGDTIAAARLRASDEQLQAAVPLAGWAGDGDGLVNVFA